MQTDSGEHLETRVVSWFSAQEQVCRCGRRIPPGTPILGVADWHPTVARILDGRPFCSVSCVRAWFLESLSELDALDTRENEELVTDLRSVFVDLALAFVELMGSGLEGGPSPPAR